MDERMAEIEKGISERVRTQYTRAPFPPTSFFPIESGPPSSRIWLYSFTEAYYHAFGALRTPVGARLLDAGCGTGHGVVQIRHLAPGAEVHACDFSAQSLAVARQRIAALGGEPVIFHELNLLDLSALPGKFDAIFCSGVVHHTANPVRALQQLKSKLKPDGVLYLMLYSQFGRYPAMLMQRVIKLLCGEPADQEDGLRLGRALFDGLPASNPIAAWERQKWGNGHRDHAEAFIDMYVNANEKNYSVRAVFDDLASAGLRFVKFAKPQLWDMAERMRADPTLLARFRALSELDQYELMEHLFPDQDQYLFFATHAETKNPMVEWASGLAGVEDRTTALRSSFAVPVPATQPENGLALWGGYYERLAWLDAPSLDLLQRCDGKTSVRDLVTAWEETQGARVAGKGLSVLENLHKFGLLYFGRFGR